MRRSGFNVGCNVAITVRDFEAKTTRTIKTHNLFTDSGCNKVRDLMAYPDLSGDGWTPEYIALGTSATATTAGMTTLVSEVFRKAITSREYIDKGYIVYLYVATDEANGNTLREIGSYSEDTAGILWARATYTGIVKTSSIDITYQWTYNIGAS
jgi:hypothetical protein